MDWILATPIFGAQICGALTFATLDWKAPASLKRGFPAVIFRRSSVLQNFASRSSWAHAYAVANTEKPPEFTHQTSSQVPSPKVTDYNLPLAAAIAWNDRTHGLLPSHQERKPLLL